MDEEGSTPTIRDAVEADLPAITDIQNALIESTTIEWTEQPHTLDSRVAWWRARVDDGCPVLVAEVDGAVVGWASYGDFRDRHRLPGYRFTAEHTIHVDRAAWGTRVAGALLAALVDRARAAGRRVLVAAVDGDNERSIRFHRRHGFDEVARMPGVGDKWGRRLDLVLLQRDLTATDSA